MKRGIKVYTQKEDPWYIYILSSSKKVYVAHILGTLSMNFVEGVSSIVFPDMFFEFFYVSLFVFN